MKNLMSRDEYLQNMNEGFIKDKLKKGWEKVKSMFKIGMKKIKNFIAIFDNEGHVLPVVSPQAVIDRFAGSDAIKVYAPKAVSQLAVEAGGSGCEEKAVARDESDYEDDGVPTGKEYFKWLHSDEQKNSTEYKNLQTMFTMIKESYGCSAEETKEIVEEMFNGEQVNESWEGQKRERIKYFDNEELDEVTEITCEKFEKKIREMLYQRVVDGGKRKLRADGKVIKPFRNMLVFGAPGIGKSTIPSAVVSAYNENHNGDPSKQISLININCSLIQEGDFMMPTMPKDADIIKQISNFSKTFPHATEYLADMDDDKKEIIAQVISSSGQFKSSEAPKTWLPSYRKTGNNEIDQMLDEYANSGVYEDADKNTVKTGSGGIILFDEFLRADPKVFNQLMNFFLDRHMMDWKLGSKWVMIACSNRPSDDGFIQKVWKEWLDSPANRDRQSRIFILTPEPEGWKKWMLEHGGDPFLMEFIFDPSSQEGEEFPRWHTAVRRGVGDAKQVAPVTPRRWTDAMEHVNAKIDYYESEHPDKKISDVSQLPIDELMDALEGIFDKSFLTEIKEWIRDHMEKIDLDGIIKDPMSVYMPKKFVDDPAGSEILIQTLLDTMKKKYEGHPEDITDDQLGNIVIWLGIHYKNYFNSVQNFIEDLNDKIFPRKSEFRFTKYVKTLMLLNAAFPQSDLEEEIENYWEKDEYTDADGETQKHLDPWPKGSLEIIKDYMRKYFPWRIDGDTIRFYGIE